MIRTLAALAWHVGGMFVLPFVLALVAGAFLEVSQVAETAPTLFALSLLVLLPVLAMQLLGLYWKVRKELALLSVDGPVPLEERLEIVLRHAKIVTPRGWAMLGAGTFLVVMALAFKFADLSLAGILALTLFYVLVGAASLMSALLVGQFEGQLASRRGTVERLVRPAVVNQGESAEERFVLRQVPIPPGWNLLIEDDLPERLATTSRYAVGPGARKGEVVVTGRLRRTPRGLYRLGPATIAFSDLFGVTRVSIASLARADLKVLPRFVPLTIQDPPRTRRELPDVRTRPHRFPTEDFFRFRAYVAGDDTRRIHWKLSVRVGELQVRQPEVREVSTRTVLLVLDSYMPPGQMLEDAVGIEEILDRLVETWLSMAKALVERGDRVTLAACARSYEGRLRPEVMEARRGTQLRWQDLGARVAWQGRDDVHALCEAAGPAMDGILVSSRFVPPPGALAGRGPMTWVYLPPDEALRGPIPSMKEVWYGDRPLLQAIFRDEHPAGADENAFLGSGGILSERLERLKRRNARTRLRDLALADGGAVLTGLRRSGHRVYQLVPGGLGHTLVGLA